MKVTYFLSPLNEFGKINYILSGWYLRRPRLKGAHSTFH